MMPPSEVSTSLIALIALDSEWEMTNYLGVITARGGSKGLPGKNIRPIGGKPTIAYSVEAALGSRYLTRTIVSTDDKEIAGICRDYGAQVPFIRPEDLSTDHIPHLPVLQHAVGFVEAEGDPVDVVILLQPTSPLRQAHDIDRSIELFLEREADTVISASETVYVVAEGDDGLISSLSDTKVGQFRRQDFSRMLDLNGAVYVMKRDDIMERNRMLGDRVYAYVMARRDSIEIDDQEDFDLVQLIMSKRGSS
jgi:CMP-N,N'-diacetyllegionaminic acid synthase